MRAFFDYYDQLSTEEKRIFRRIIIDACRIEHPTFYSWINKKRIPANSRKLISIELKISESELFPETESTNTKTGSNG